jgi:ABC-type transport system substrate-binding protein
LEYGGGQYVSWFPAALDEWDLKQEEFPNYLPWKHPKDDAVRTALQGLSAAGFARDNPLRFVMDVQSATGAYKSGGELGQAQWRRLAPGIVEADLFFNTGQAVVSRKQSEKSYAYMYAGSAAATLEPDTWLQQLYRSNGSRNYAGTNDSRLDTMIDNQRRIFDVQQRKAAIREIITYMIDSVPRSFGVGRLELFAAQPEVRGYIADSYVAGAQYENVWLDT